MICPYCHVEYTPSNPCFCQPRVKNASPENANQSETKSEEHSPTGLDNPFWHC